MTFQHQQVHAGSGRWSCRIQFAIVYLSQLYKATSKKLSQGISVCVPVGVQG